MCCGWRKKIFYLCWPCIIRQTMCEGKNNDAVFQRVIFVEATKHKISKYWSTRLVTIFHWKRL